MDSKKIKQKILNYELEISSLEKYLNDDFKNTITGMINALFSLLRHSTKNEKMIEEIIKEIEYLVEEEEEKVRLKLICKLLEEINDRINNYFSKKNKNEIDDLRKRLINVLNLTKTKMENEKDISSQILHNIIFIDKDLAKLRAIVNNDSKISFKKIDKIFLEVLSEYLKLEDEEEIKYYYKVITIFLKSLYRNKFLYNTGKYVNLLEKNKNKYHVNLIIDRLQNKPIFFADLESKYDIKFDNQLQYQENKEMSKLLRYDYTMKNVLTIDESGNLCNDDAFSVERNSDGTYTLYIYISDVPGYIKKDDQIELMAYKKAETIYLKDGSIPMFPSEFSNYYGSLIESQTRKVIAFVFKFTPTFEIIPDSFAIRRANIKVNKNLSYMEANNLIKYGNSDTAKMLRVMSKMAESMKKDNVFKDIYRKIENKTKSNSNNEMTNSSFAQVSPADNIIQEMMILVNHFVAKYFSNRDFPYIYRVHNEPSEDIKDELIMLLELAPETLINNPNCEKTLNLVKESYLNAKYDINPNKHYGLNLTVYSHSTSPLRRYADTLGQYIMHDLIFNGNIEDKNIYKWEKILKEVIPYLNERDKLDVLFVNEYNYLCSKKRIRKK